MTATLTQHEALVAAVRDAVDGHPRREDTTLDLCPRGIHLRAARRWRGQCTSCGQPIPSGAVGLATWDDERTCAAGGYNHQHGCGGWNSPVEVTTDLNDVDLDGAIANVDPDGLNDAIVDYAWDLVDTAIDELDRLVAEEQETEVETIRTRLTGELADAMQRLDDGEDPDDVTTGSEIEPGIYRENDEWIAWDYDPRRPGEGEPITVTEADLT